VAEKHRLSFLAAFPEHAPLLPAGDLASLMAVLAWLFLTVAFLLHIAFACKRWSHRSEVMFFPDKSGKNVQRICSTLSHSRHRIWLAMFTFTDDLLSEELVRARERGVDVRVIVDDAQCDMQGAEAAWLANSGVPVTTDRSDARMHHKFVVSDNTVLSGSFNWTRQASIANNENLCVIRDPHLVKSFAREFGRLWQQFNDRGGRLRGKRAKRRCHTPPTHMHGGG
jgi:phosphatidylserine/phosphatidylglycerophosphate/cardiolipin synthase-like enzyme